jgi:phage gp29-like protein
LEGNSSFLFSPPFVLDGFSLVEVGENLVKDLFLFKNLIEKKNLHLLKSKNRTSESHRTVK